MPDDHDGLAQARDANGTSGARRRAWIALALIAPAPSVGVIVGLTAGQGALGVALWCLSKVWLFVLPVAWWLWVDRGRLSWSPLRKGGLTVGAITGLAIAAIIVAAYLVIGDSAIDPQTLADVIEETGLTKPEVFIGGAVYWVTINSVLEEYVYRWFIFGKAERVAGGAGGVVLSAAIFTIHHAIALAGYMPWWSAGLASLGVFIGGVVWSALYLRYRSIWPCYLSHAIVDVAVFSVGYHLLFVS